VNGPARVHAELALLSDVVLASETAVFGDRPHFPDGVVPGDGVHVIWPALLGGINRSRYFFFTEQEFTARQALDLGLVGEVVAPDKLLARARELARQLNKKPRLTLRYTRALLTRSLKKAVLDELTYGIALEGISIAALKSESRPNRRTSSSGHVLPTMPKATEEPTA
jgi:enoyl-CoA hydratase/carnithine racemase